MRDSHTHTTLPRIPSPRPDFADAPDMNAAIEAYHDRCERILNEEMIAEDFRPYINDPPEHVLRDPEGSYVYAYGDPLDFNSLSDDLNIWRVNWDLTSAERNELRKAIKEVWPEEALV